MDINFDEIQTYLEAEAQLREVGLLLFLLSMNDRTLISTPFFQKIRDEVLELEKKTRSLTGTLNKIHSTREKDGKSLHCANFLNSAFRGVPLSLALCAACCMLLC